MRIISLLPGATEIVAALGAADALVAVSHECDYPPSVAALPRVTRSSVDGSASPAEVDRAVRAIDARGAPLYELDDVRIASLAPDLIITQGICDVCAVSEGDVRAVAARLPSAPAVVSLAGSTLDDVLNDISAVGSAVRAGGAADALVAELRGRMQRVHDTLRRAAAPRPRVAVLEWTDPLFAAGHWVPRVVARAGGIEIMATEGQRSRVISMTDLASAAPDVIVVAPCGYDVARAAAEGERLLAQADWSTLGDVRVWAIDANALLSRPGPRLVDGIETLAALLHPTLFPPPPPHRAVRLDG